MKNMGEDLQKIFPGDIDHNYIKGDKKLIDAICWNYY